MITPLIKITDLIRYLPVIHADDGCDYVLHNDGGIGPMSTGTDEWGVLNSYGSLQFVDGDRALEIMTNPNRGYGKAPAGTLKVYKLRLEETAFNVDQERRKRALAKLTPEEQALLGVTE